MARLLNWRGHPKSGQLKLISLFTKNTSSLTAAARALYATIVNQSREPGFFTIWGIPDTPNGRFEVLALHFFLVMHRMRGDKNCVKLARSLSEQAVLDIDRNLREMGVGDLSVGRKVKSLTEGLYGRLSVYADGMAGEDGSLGEELRRNLFSEVEAENWVVQAAELYLRRERNSLLAWGTVDLLAGRVSFGKGPVA
tara:strand:- start:586 stop:1173 length:588 start_codon:yes stop_codon:yes gene_type:complete